MFNDLLTQIIFSFTFSNLKLNIFSLISEAEIHQKQTKMPGITGTFSGNEQNEIMIKGCLVNHAVEVGVTLL